MLRKKLNSFSISFNRTCGAVSPRSSCMVSLDTLTKRGLGYGCKLTPKACLGILFMHKLDLLDYVLLHDY
jgi:hypothetical protein